MQNYINSNKIKENKYKILRMSLILGADDNRDETITNFEESAREIDAMNDETYLSELENKFYDTLKLEEEEKKLAELVDYIGGRVEQRISLLSDFANVTGYDLTNLPPIKYYDKLDDYKERLKYIREYLENTEQIESLTIEIEEAERKLKETQENKTTAEEYNVRNEEIILSKFKGAVKTLEIFNNLTIDNIDSKLNNVISNVEESKKSLDIFEKSYNTLRGSGISYEEEAEYKSYVDNAKEIYYTNKEQEYLLRIYNLLLTKQKEYSEIKVKRDTINEIIRERLELRKILEIESNDILNPLYDLLEKQYKDITGQKNNIDGIEYLNRLIALKKNEKNELELDNQKVEILSLLREFCLIDAFADIEETSIDNQKETVSDNIEETISNDIEEDIFTKDLNSTTNDIDTTNNDTDTINDDIEIEDEDTDNSNTSIAEDYYGIQSTPVETDIPSIEEEITIPNIEFNFDNTNTQEETIEEQKKETTEEIKEEPVEEIIKENQVIEVTDSKNIDFDLIHSKASKVMKRVGEMLGIKVEETTIVSVTSDEEQPKEEPPKTEELPKEEEPVPVENPLFNTTEISAIEQTENPLFESNENPLFTTDLNNDNNSSVDPEDDSSFWFSSDMPDALNDLPDLDVSNENFFGNSSMPDLNFPDLKIDFGQNDTEAK